MHYRYVSSNFLDDRWIYIIITKNIRCLLWNQGLWRSLDNTYPTFLTSQHFPVASNCDVTMTDCSRVVAMDTILMLRRVILFCDPRVSTRGIASLVNATDWMTSYQTAVEIPGNRASLRLLIAISRWWNGRGKRSGFFTCSSAYGDISMGECKKDVTSLLTYWSYVFLALTHRYVRQLLHTLSPAMSSANNSDPWWRHQMEIFPALLAILEGNPSVTVGVPSLKPVTWSFDVFFDLRPEQTV